MPSSDIAIANLALGHIGQRPNVASLDPPEGSAHAELAAQFFPFARDALLEAHPWNWATRRVAGAPLATTIDAWDYAYAKPADAVKILAVLPQDATDDYVEMIDPGVFALPQYAARSVPVPFVVERLETGEDAVLTDQVDAVIRYTARVTDPGRYSSLFTMALSWQLASMLAGPILKGEAGASESKRCVQMVDYYLQSAKDSDTRQRRVRPAHQVPWMAAR